MATGNACRPRVQGWLQGSLATRSHSPLAAVPTDSLLVLVSPSGEASASPRPFRAELGWLGKVSRRSLCAYHVSGHAKKEEEPGILVGSSHDLEENVFTWTDPRSIPRKSADAGRAHPFSPRCRCSTSTSIGPARIFRPSSGGFFTAPKMDSEKPLTRRSA